MSNGVMIAVDSKTAEMIVDGRKLDWVAMSIPKIEPPFTVYMCIKGPDDGKSFYDSVGSVIGEFECYGYDRFEPNKKNDGVVFYRFMALMDTGMSMRHMLKYMGGKNAYGWRIRGVIVYDVPLNVSEFGLKEPPKTKCYVEEKVVKPNGRVAGWLFVH